MDKLMKEDKPKTIELGGKEYKLSPLNFNVLAYIEEELNCSIEDMGKLINKKGAKKMAAIRTLIHIFLRDNHPDLTIQKMGEMLTLQNVEEVMSKVNSIIIGE